MAGPGNTQFALAAHMLTLLAGGAPTQSSEEMAGSAGSNPVHVRRVLGRLRAAGLVDSKPGVGGGWRLLVDPQQTTLAEVWRAMHGDDASVLAIHEANPDCSVGQSVQATLHEIDRRAAEAVETELAGTTIAALVKAPAAV